MLSLSNLPVLDMAWNQYKQDHNVERLLETAFQQPDSHSAPQILLWIALGIGDRKPIKALENRNVSLPNDTDCEPGLIYSMVYDFGDAPDGIEWLLQHGAKIDARGPNDWTALHLACHEGHLGAVATLIKNGADVNTQTSCDGGWTPLMEACASGKKDVVEFLLAHGADPEIRNSMEGATAGGIAVLRGHPDLAAVLDSWSVGAAGRKRAAGRHRREDKRKD